MAVIASNVKYQDFVKVFFQYQNAVKLYRNVSGANKSDRNYYTVLGLDHNCSVKDIKQAYVKLCKKCHPDMKPGDVSQHKKFVELNNAYTTLVNSHSRREYDLKLSSSPNSQQMYWQPGGAEPYFHNARRNDNSWYTRGRAGHFHDDDVPRYTVKRYSNKWVVFGCISLMFIGTLLYAFAYNFAKHYASKKAEEKSRKISIQYEEVRRRARENSKEVQMENLRKLWKLPDTSPPKD